MRDLRNPPRLRWAGLRRHGVAGLAGLWLGVVIWFGALRISPVHPSWIAPATWLLVLAASAPLVGAEARRRRAPGPIAWSSVVLVLLAEGLLSAGLAPSAFYGMSHWTALVSPVIGIVLVRQGRLDAALTMTFGGLLITLSAAIVGSMINGPAWFWLNAPLVAAVIGSAWLTTFLRSCERTRREYVELAERDLVLSAQAEAVEHTVGQRRSELRQLVVPLLRELRAGEELDSGLQQRAAAAARELRDGLSARQVLTGPTRELLAQARRSGTTVAVVDDRPEPANDETSAAARRLMELSLPVAAGGEVTYRLSPDGKVTCVVTELPADDLAELARILTTQSAAVILTDEALWAQVD